MPQITAIEPQKRRKGRFNVFADGNFSFSVDEKILVDEKLEVGKNLTQDKIEKIITEYELSKILEKVFNFLSFRPRSKREILDYLKRKNVGEEVQKIILAKLEKLSYVNDLEFAKFFVESRVKFRPKGKRLIAAELAQKGIDKEIIEKVLSETQTSEIDLAKVAISKKLERFLKLPELGAKQKISQFLARRGFSWETIKTIIDSSLKTE